MKKSIILLKIVSLSIALSSEFIFNRQKLWAMPQLKPATLIELNGKDKLLYRPNRNTDYKPASLYMELKLNYHLWLKLGGNAAIMCPNDSNIIDILQGKQTVANLGCPKIYTDESSFLRGGDNSNLPFIISPRNTAIITNKPTIRWNDLPNVEEYQITLYSDSENKAIWSIASSSANARLHSPSANFPLPFIEMDYPQDQPPLEVGQKYRVIVTAEKKIKPTEECPDGWRKRDNNPFKCYVSSDFEELPAFNQLDLSTVEEIKTRKTEFQQRFNDVEEDLALAYLYDNNNLNMDAIEILENLVDQGNQTPRVYEFLGRLYKKIQLNSLAEDRYQKAIELAKKQQNLEQQALAQWGLAQILQSIELAAEAKKAYEEIGDSEEVDKIQEKIDKWR